MLKIRVPIDDFFMIDNVKVGIEHNDWLTINGARIKLQKDTDNRMSILIDAPKSVKVLRSKHIDITKVTDVRCPKKAGNL